MTSLAAALTTDFELISQARSGERRAFEMLVRRHNQRLFRAARAVTRADADAEDALQQAWLQIFRHLASFRGESSFATWATRIAVNAAIAISRRASRLEVVDLADDAAADPPSGEPGLPAVEQAQLGALIERCLARIPQGHREVMVLRDVLELDTADTAACLGLSEEAVRVRLHRARAAVAAELSETLGEHLRDIYGFDGARCDRITAFVLRNI